LIAQEHAIEFDCTQGHTGAAVQLGEVFVAFGNGLHLLEFSILRHARHYFIHLEFELGVEYGLEGVLLFFLLVLVYVNDRVGLAVVCGHGLDV